MKTTNKVPEFKTSEIKASRNIQNTQKIIATIINLNDKESYFLKTYLFNDNTLQSRFFKVGFDLCGEMIALECYGLIYSDANTSLINAHDTAFFKVFKQ